MKIQSDRETIGTLTFNDATAMKGRLKSEFAFFQSLSQLFLPTYFVKCINPPGVEFFGAISKYRKINKISSLLVYVLHKAQNLAFSRRSRAKTGKKMSKKA